MLKFLEEILGHSDDIIYGAGTELYNRMAQDTQDRHSKFAVWGDQLQKDLHDRKKSLQLQQSNYNEAINSLKSVPPEELSKDLLLKNIDIDTYLAPLSSQLGTGMFLGDRNEILNRIMHFLKEAPIKTDTPFVPAENYFEQNFDKLDNKMQSISGMGYNTWRSLTKKGELSMLEGTEPVKFKEEDKLRSDIEVSSMSAKAFGILNTYPGTIEGNQNLQFQQTNLIVANSNTQFPDNLESRADFINKKLYENKIDPMVALNYSNPLAFKQIATIVDAYGKENANAIAAIINQLKNPELSNEAKQNLNDQLNQLTLSQHQLMDEYSKTVPRILAGEDQSTVMGTATTGKEEVIVPQVAENYLPRLDNKGDLIIKYDNGETQNLSLEMLLTNPDNLKGIPKVAQDYVLKIQDSLFEDGQMIEPTREMFKKGAAGDKAFKDFLEIYFGFNPEIGLTGHTGKGGVELHHSFSDWFKNIYEGTKTLGTTKSGTKKGPGSLRTKHYADIDQFVTNEVALSLDTDAFPITTDSINIKELNQGETIKQDEVKQPIQEKKKVNPKQSGSSFLKHQEKGISSEASDAIKQLEEQAIIQGDNAAKARPISLQMTELTAPAITKDKTPAITITKDTTTDYPPKDIAEIYANNNPGMIKYFKGSGWKGETFEGKLDKNGDRIVYRKYPNKAAGLLDILKVIKGYNLTDIDDIMNKYASDDGSGKVIEDYGGILQSRGVPKKINMLNRDHLEALLFGIVHVENSIHTYKGKPYEKSYTQHYKQKDYDSAINKFLNLVIIPPKKPEQVIA